MVNKKGMSELVATVLLVLITIAAIGIIYGAVVPLVRQGVQSAQTCNEIGLEVKTEGYTCLDSTLKEVNVQVAKGPSDTVLEAIQIQVSGDGVSRTVQVRDNQIVTGVKELGKNYTNTLTLPKNNEARTYVLNLTALGLTSAENVAAAPVTQIGKEEYSCPLSTSIAVSECK